MQIVKDILQNDRGQTISSMPAAVGIGTRFRSKKKKKKKCTLYRYIFLDAMIRRFDKKNPTLKRLNMIHGIWKSPF